MSTSTRELLIADTTFASVWHATASAASATRQWPRSTVERIANATLSISVVTVAEVRFGHLNARWGIRRRQEAERRLSQFQQLRVDRPTAEAWAFLKDSTQRAGRSCGDNDLWIAATGFVRGVPVVTCDVDFLSMTCAGVDVIYLPRHPHARSG